MCTVTVVPATVGAIPTSRAPLARLVCNRDEQRSRPPSSAPVRRRIGDRSVIMPVDPPSGGTWIGANDAGLVACLLNANRPGTPGSNFASRARLSRGSIVPALLAAGSIENAFALAGDIDVTRFPPFRTLVMTTDSLFVASSDGATLTRSEPAPLLAPLLLASSGLGDHLVEDPRRSVFDRLLSRAADPMAAQVRFHDHPWHDRPHLSVLMSRPDARTVSRSAVDLLPDSIVLTHTNLDDRLAPDGPITRVELPSLHAGIAA